MELKIVVLERGESNNGESVEGDRREVEGQMKIKMKIR
jgi:hypothetical protein